MFFKKEVPNKTNENMKKLRTCVASTKKGKIRNNVKNIIVLGVKRLTAKYSMARKIEYDTNRNVSNGRPCE
ncbi:hypothetical protein NCCP2648_04470 [Lacticaseibacillus rhamnosus]|nr:hypothetical protein NCCP2648_04470 [Lacticaseibacillus rhamnosus]